MLSRAAAKLTSVGRAAAVRFVHGSAASLADDWSALGARVDGVFSNFAPLNCELSLRPVRRLLEQALAPGGRFVGVVLPRVCPLGDRALSRARRAAHRLPPVPARAGRPTSTGRTFPMRYYGARDFDRGAGAGFPPRRDAQPGDLACRRSASVPRLARAPRLLAALGARRGPRRRAARAAHLGDHVIVAYERL